MARARAKTIAGAIGQDGVRPTGLAVCPSVVVQVSFRLETDMGGALLCSFRFSLEECNQVFAHMSIDLKRILKDRLEAVAPEYGLHEVLYTSFTRSHGYRGLVSASDVVHAVTGLLEASPEALVALGHRSEWVAEETLSAGVALSTDNHQEQDSAQGSTSWWHNNFFRACDSLDGGGGEEDQLQRGLKQCMKIQQALVRQAIAIIEKQVIITLSTCRVATLKDGPNLSIFWNPLTLGKLAQFLVHAIRVSSFSMLLKMRGGRGESKADVGWTTE